MATPRPATKYYERSRKRFTGNISCACGNSDWERFLYVYAGSRVVVGCKLCGQIQEFNEEVNDDDRRD